MEKEIINYIKLLTNNNKVQELLTVTIGKILSKYDDIDVFIKENENKIIHIRDWMYSVVENNEQWKTPRVLTVEALNNAADKYFEKQNNKLEKIKLDETHEKLIADLGDYYVVKMLTPEALDNESKQMQHCIGHGGYDYNLDNKNYQYLSLRDKYNKAHVTLEIEYKHIRQLQGKQNEIPEFRYLEILIPWLIKNKIKIMDWDKIGKYFDEDKWIEFDEIELIENIDYEVEKDIDGFKIYRNLSQKFFDKYFYSEKFREEEFIYFNKDGKIGINVSGKEDKENLYRNVIDYLNKKAYKFSYQSFGFILNVADCKYYYIHDLPDMPFVLDTMRIHKSKLKKLPKNLTVLGDFTLYDCMELKELPENFIVRGDLWIPNIGAERIPDNIKIYGGLNISDSKIKYIPENLKCKKLVISKDQIDLITNNMDFQVISISGTGMIYEKHEFFDEKNKERINNLKMIMK